MRYDFNGLNDVVARSLSKEYLKLLKYGIIVGQRKSDILKYFYIYKITEIFSYYQEKKVVIFLI